jgi:hypothetical protein
MTQVPLTTIHSHQDIRFLEELLVLVEEIGLRTNKMVLVPKPIKLSFLKIWVKDRGLLLVNQSHHREMKRKVINQAQDTITFQHLLTGKREFIRWNNLIRMRPLGLVLPKANKIDRVHKLISLIVVHYQI